MTEWIDEVWYEDGGMAAYGAAGGGGGAGYGTTTTSTIANYFQIVGSQTNTASATTVNMNNPYRIWVREDTQARANQISRMWTQQQAQYSQQLSSDRTAGTMYIQWTSMYGTHMAERTERDRAREALDRHDGVQRKRIETQAVERAEALLVSHLSPQQRADYQRSKFFMVDGKSGRRYRINRGHTANVDLMLPDGKVEARLCAVLYDCPLPDQLLSQKLHIELAEKEFLAVAIRHAA